MRILIATVTCGAGHVQAAAALEEAWKAWRPRDVVARVDALDFAPALYRKAYVQGYVKLIAHAPALYARFFDLTDNPRLMTRLTSFRRLSSRLATRGFRRYIQRFRPNIVLATHFMPLEVLGSMAWRNRRPFVTCVVTDFEAHAFWQEPTVDLYCVATQETGARLLGRGVKKENVTATGIPVSLRFSKKLRKSSLRRKLGLGHGPVILVLGGGFGMGPLEKVMKEVDKVEKNVEIMVVAGRNEALRKSLAGWAWRHPTQVLGFVTHMEELMTAADLVVTKPGGLTSSEALALGRPLMIVNPIPGQEAANSDYLLGAGAAAKVNRLEDLSPRLQSLLGSSKLKAMARAAKAAGKPRSALAVCRESLKRVARV